MKYRPIFLRLGALAGGEGGNLSPPLLPLYETLGRGREGEKSTGKKDSRRKGRGEQMEKEEE